MLMRANFKTRRPPSIPAQVPLFRCRRPHRSNDLQLCATPVATPAIFPRLIGLLFTDDRRPATAYLYSKRAIAKWTARKTSEWLHRETGSWTTVTRQPSQPRPWYSVLRLTSRITDRCRFFWAHQLFCFLKFLYIISVFKILSICATL